jgi:hypothetical protein
VLPHASTSAPSKPAAPALAAMIELLSAEVDRADSGAQAVIGSLVDLHFGYLLHACFTTHTGNGTNDFVTRANPEQ